MAESEFGANEFDFLLACRERTSKSYALASELRRRIGALLSATRCDTLPVDLDSVASQVGIVRVTAVPLAIRGRLLRVPQGLAVEVNAALDELDQRFVLAHEIAHVLLERDDILSGVNINDRPRGVAGASHSLIESLCDFGAREFLLPYRIVRGRLRQHGPDLTAVARVAAESGCSFDVTAQRVEEAAVWRCRFIWWIRSDTSVYPVKSVPHSSQETLSRVRLKDERQSLVVKAFEEKRSVAGRETIAFWDEVAIYKAQAMPLTDDVVVSLLDYS